MNIFKKYITYKKLELVWEQYYNISAVRVLLSSGDVYRVCVLGHGWRREPLPRLDLFLRHGQPVTIHKLFMTLLTATPLPETRPLQLLNQKSSKQPDQQLYGGENVGPCCFWFDSTVTAAIFFFFFFFGMANSMINPLIYGAFHICRCSSSAPASGAGGARAAGLVAPQAR